MNKFDKLIITKIITYLNIIEIQHIKSISKNFYHIVNSIIPNHFYNSNWIKQLINTLHYHHDHNLTSLLKINYNIYNYPKIFPWIERMLLDAAQSGNLNTLIWIKNLYFKNELFNLRRANRCLVYTAHHQNISMVNFLINYIHNYQFENFFFHHKNYPNLYRTYIACIRLRNHVVFSYLWKSFPYYNKKILKQLLLHCEIHYSIKIYLLIFQFIQLESHIIFDQTSISYNIQ